MIKYLFIDKLYMHIYTSYYKECKIMYKLNYKISFHSNYNTCTLYIIGFIQNGTSFLLLMLFLKVINILEYSFKIDVLEFHAFISLKLRMYQNIIRTIQNTCNNFISTSLSLKDLLSTIFFIL